MLAALAIPQIPGNGLSDLLTNRVFLVGFWSWFSAQFLKVRVHWGGPAYLLFNSAKLSVEFCYCWAGAAGVNARGAPAYLPPTPHFAG